MYTTMHDNKASISTFGSIAKKAKDPEISKEVASCSNSSRLGYLESFVRFHYYICLIPFRPVATDQGHRVTTFLPQQIICAIFHISTMLYQGQIVARTLQEDVLAEPLKVIPLAFAVGDTLYICCWIHSFWRKQTQLVELISVLSSPKCPEIYKPFYSHVTNWTLAFVPIIFLIYTRLHPPTDLYNLAGGFSGNCTEVNSTIDRIMEIAGIPRELIFHCGEILILVLSLSAYCATSNYLESKSESADYPKKDTFVLRLDGYKETAKYLKTFFRKFNDFSSGFYFTWFCTTVPWLSFRPLQTLQRQNFPWIFIFNWTLMIMYGVIWGCCAEVKRKAHMFKDMVEDDFYEHLSQDSTIMAHSAGLKQLKYAVSNCGVQAGRFFQFSYECFGSVIGLAIAYALIFIQFHPRITVTE